MGDPTFQLLHVLFLLLGGLSTAGIAALEELASDPLIREEEDPLARLARSPRPVLAACRLVLVAELLAAGALAVRSPFPLGRHDAPRVVLTLVIVGLAQLVLAGALPRGLAVHDPVKTGRTLRGWLTVLSVLLRPLTALVGLLAGLFLMLVRIDPRAEAEQVSEEDIRLMVDMGEEKGAIEKEERELIENVFEFNNSTAEEVMVHRTDVVMIWAEDSDAEIMEAIRTSGLSRFPVYEEDPDDIIGTLNTRDYLLNARLPEPKPLRQLLRKAYFVPESVRTDVLFRDMQSRKIHFAVVVDEYGGTSGIITMEDLLEELVGNIYDEFDPQEDQAILPLDENLWRVAGSVELDELAEALDMDFPEDEEAETLGGLVFTRLDVIPADGTHPTVTAHGLRIQVEELSDRRVEWAKVSKLASENTEG